MIEWISNWAQGIIIAVIIGTILEMLLPKNNASKFVRCVIGIYILFSIISPVISRFTNLEFDISNAKDLKDFENSQSSTQSIKKIQDENNLTIKNMYQENLKIDMTSKLKSKGFIVKCIEVNILDNEEYTIQSIDIIIEKKEIIKEQNHNEVTTIVDNIQNINIDIKNNNDEMVSVISESEKSDIKKYISNTYEVSEKNINVN